MRALLLLALVVAVTGCDSQAQHDEPVAALTDPDIDGDGRDDYGFIVTNHGAPEGGPWFFELKFSTEWYLESNVGEGGESGSVYVLPLGHEVGPAPEVGPDLDPNAPEFWTFAMSNLCSARTDSGEGWGCKAAWLAPEGAYVGIRLLVESAYETGPTGPEDYRYGWVHFSVEPPEGVSVTEFPVVTVHDHALGGPAETVRVGEHP
jgi:hypothetical protein